MHHRGVPSALVAAAIVASLFIVRLSAGPAADPARAFLAAAFGVTPAELTRIDAGQVVARTLATKNSREVATVGVARIRTTPAVYVERLHDIVNFKLNERVLQIGVFGTPPQLSDMAGFTLADADMKRLKDCRVGDCSVRLPADVIERMRKEINWRAADAPARASNLLRQAFVQYVAKYRESGAGAAMDYADTAARLNTEREFKSMAFDDPAVWLHVPSMRRHLLEFPAIDKERSRDLVYWSKELVNGREVLSLTHVAIVRMDDGSPVTYAAASKQLYAMHYYDASLGLTLLVPDTTSASPAMYVVYLNKSRVDLFDGFLGGIARRVVAGKARTLVAELLAGLQKSLGA